MYLQEMLDHLCDDRCTFKFVFFFVAVIVYFIFINKEKVKYIAHFWKE